MFVFKELDFKICLVCKKPLVGEKNGLEIGMMLGIAQKNVVQIRNLQTRLYNLIKFQYY